MNILDQRSSEIFDFDLSTQKRRDWLVQDVLAVCIPKFQEEPTILLVDSEDQLRCPGGR